LQSWLQCQKTKQKKLQCSNHIPYRDFHGGKNRFGQLKNFSDAAVSSPNDYILNPCHYPTSTTHGKQKNSNPTQSFWVEQLNYNNPTSHLGQGDMLIIQNKEVFNAKSSMNKTKLGLHTFSIQNAGVPVCVCVLNML